MALIQYQGTGRRKLAVARVFLRPGKGIFTVNGRPFDEYFQTPGQKMAIKQPLLLTETIDKFDILARCIGGGINGQAGAMRLGVAKALLSYNAELRKKLKKAGYLTRDSRTKERKKYGQKGARKRFQFSKR
ncbi:MAG: 30S ribosomal protein S9 [Acidobacteriota bacterium]